MRFQTTTTALLAALAALVLVFPGPASAAIDPASYQHVDVIFDYPAPFGEVGDFIFCPERTKAVALGVISSGLHDLLRGGFTTFDGNGAFAIAAGEGGRHLQISARCVDAAQVQGSTLATTVIHDHRPPPAGFLQAGRASCPPGTVAYGGGGFHSLPFGGPPIGGDSMYASMPDADGTGWFFAAAGSLFPDKELWISTHCLPRAQFGEIRTVIATDTAPPYTPSNPYPILQTSVRCPAGFSAYAGGAWLQRVGSSTPEWVGYLTVSIMTADDRGWFARGWAHNIGEGVQLTVTVQCMTRRID
jgi:hypothetical protein